jgi:hypothetical protein
VDIEKRGRPELSPVLCTKCKKHPASKDDGLCTRCRQAMKSKAAKKKKAA